jgi:hypothetical protein
VTGSLLSILSQTGHTNMKEDEGVRISPCFNVILAR